MGLRWRRCERKIGTPAAKRRLPSGHSNTRPKMLQSASLPVSLNPHALRKPPGQNSKRGRPNEASPLSVRHRSPRRLCRARQKDDGRVPQLRESRQEVQPPRRNDRTARDRSCAKRPRHLRGLYVHAAGWTGSRGSISTTSTTCYLALSMPRTSTCPLAARPTELSRITSMKFRTVRWMSSLWIAQRNRMGTLR